MTREVLSTGQVAVFMVISRVSVALVYLPAAFNPDLKQDLWLSELVGTLCLIPFAWVLSRLWQRFPRQTFAEVLEIVLGKALGKTLVAWYAFQWMWAASANLRMAGEFFVSVFLPRTPIIVVMGVVAFLAAWAAAAGAEVMGRASQVVLPLVVGTILAVLVLLLKDIEFGALAPVFIQSGPVAMLKEMFTLAARTSEVLMVGLLVPFVREPRGLFRATALALAAMGVLLALLAIPVTGVLGPTAQLMNFPYYTALTQMSVVEFIENLDAVLLGVWLFAMFLRIGLFLWTSAVSAAQGLGLQRYQPLVVPLAGISVTYAITQVESLSELRGYLRPVIFTPFLLVTAYGIPMLVLAVAVVRGKRGDGDRSEGG